jgi:hypothetical protein
MTLGIHCNDWQAHGSLLLAMTSTILKLQVICSIMYFRAFSFNSEYWALISDWAPPNYFSLKWMEEGVIFQNNDSKDPSRVSRTPTYSLRSKICALPASGIGSLKKGQ